MNKKIKDTFKKWVSGAIALITVISLSASPVLQAYDHVETNIYPEWKEPAFTKEDVVYTHYNLEDFQTVSKNFLEKLGYKDGSFDQTLSKQVTQETMSAQVDTLLAEYDTFSTMYSFVQFQYSEDISNKEISDELTHMKNLYTDVFNEMLSVLHKVQGHETLGPLLDTHLGEARATNLRETIELTPRQKEINEKMTSLEQEFDTLSGEKKKTGRDNDRIGEIYIELIGLRNEYAKEEGYENYANMIEENTYGRDYDMQELSEYYEDVKTYIAPLYFRLGMTTNFDSLDRYTYPDGKDALAVVGEYLPNISSELHESYQYMVDKNLYTLGNSENNEQVSYTISIPNNRSALIFAYNYSPYNNMQTLIHEFGHFNTAVRRTSDSFFSQSNVDLAEIHSQGLELLFTPYYEDMYGSVSKVALNYALLNIIWAILTGAMYNEFETYVHTQPNITPEQVNEKYNDISSEYMIPAYSDTDWQFYHMFHAPFYYLSYSVSAMAASGLLPSMKDDWRGTVDKYLKLTSLGEETHPFRETLKEAGMVDIFADNAVEEIANAIDEFSHDPFLLDANEQTTQTQDQNNGSEETSTTIDLPEFGEDDTNDTTQTTQKQTDTDPSDTSDTWNGDGEKGILDIISVVPNMLRYIFSGDFWEDLGNVIGDK